MGAGGRPKARAVSGSGQCRKFLRAAAHGIPRPCAMTMSECAKKNSQSFVPGTTVIKQDSIPPNLKRGSSRLNLVFLRAKIRIRILCRKPACGVLAERQDHARQRLSRIK